MALAAVSCNKEMTPEEGVAGGNSVKVTITTAPELAMDTKTTITQDPSDPNLYIPSWLGTEKMGVWVDDIPANGEAQPEFLTNTEAGPVATFTGDIEITAGQHIIYGYASSAEKYFNKYYPGSLVGFDVPQVQYPTLTSFDSDADLLIAKAQTVEVSDGQTDLSIDNVQFTRALAVLKVILKDGSSKGVKGNAVVKSLTLSPSDVDNEPLTGRASIDVKNGGSITKFNTNTDVKAEYTDESFVINDENAAEKLGSLHGIIVPGGFGDRGIAGMVSTARYARENGIPYFGICLGMQVAVIEYARNVCGLKDADSGEFAPGSANKVIDFMPGQSDDIDKGGTLRLGSYPCEITPGSTMERCYQASEIHERHRHRYEFNNDYREILTKAGLNIGGLSPDGRLVEAVELSDRPFYVGVQYHPEFKSRPNRPHPLFVGFIDASIKNRKTS